MYRIVVADDEEYVRELVAQNINRSQTDFYVIGKAENGQEAVRLVEELRPDILITDICMPFVSGLELISQIREKNPQIKTVIISGYDDFTYAKQALSLGVTEYLLKPFLPDELYEVLNKIRGELERHKTLLNNIQEMKEQIEDSRQIVKEQIIQNLVQGKGNPEKLFEEASREGIELSNKFCAVGILKIYGEIQEQAVKQLLTMIHESYFPQNCEVYAINAREQQLILMFLGNYRNAALFCNAIRSGLQSLEKSFQRYYALNSFSAIGGVYQEWKKIPASYENALALHRKTLGTVSQVIFFDEEIQRQESDEQEFRGRPKELEQQLLLNIQMGQEDKAEETLMEILRYYECMNVSCMDFVSVSLVELVFDISSTLAKLSGQGLIWEDEKVISYLKKHFTSGTLRDAQEVIWSYVQKCCRQFASVNESQGERIVFQVKDLIEKNIDQEDLNLEKVAGKLFFSHNYVRQIFKQVTGESFMEYLIRRRMEMAGQLLKNERLKIQDIAEKTGYSNQRYFASCFKKYYGCTPTEYRNQQK